MKSIYIFRFSSNKNVQCKKSNCIHLKSDKTTTTNHLNRENLRFERILSGLNYKLLTTVV